jgi:hypothetical protein
VSVLQSLEPQACVWLSTVRYLGDFEIAWSVVVGFGEEHSSSTVRKRNNDDEKIAGEIAKNDGMDRLRGAPN